MADLKALKTKKKVLKSNITKLRERVNATIEMADMAQVELFDSKTKSYVGIK